MMAKNPMQRKVTNAFLGGVVLTFVISALVAVAVLVLVILPGQESQTEGTERRTVYVITRNVRSGEELVFGVNVDRQTIQTAVMQSVSPEGLSARIDLEPGTVLTNAMAFESDHELTHDTRELDLNMITLPMGLVQGDYIDVRLTLPNGTDLVVISRQRVMGIEGETITLHLTEEEMLLMHSAIVENYIITASNLHAVRFVDPGMQLRSTFVTYYPTHEVAELINSHPNIASDIIRSRPADYRNIVQNARNPYNVDANANIERRMAQQVEAAREARRQFLAPSFDF